MSSFEFSGEGFNQLHATVSALGAVEHAVGGIILRDRSRPDAYFHAGVEPPTVTQVLIRRSVIFTGLITRVSIGEDGEPLIEAGYCKAMPNCEHASQNYEIIRGSTEIIPIEDYDTQRAIYDDMCENATNFIVTSK